MGRMHAHHLTSKNIDALTGVCTTCGDVKLARRTKRGPAGERQVFYRCSVIVAAQRKSPGWYTRKWGNLRRPHGLTTAEAKAYREGKVCGICGTDQSIVVDHSHVTGLRRGTLCSAHNRALGHFGDSIAGLEAAIDYLRAAEEAEAPDPSSTTAAS